MRCPSRLKFEFLKLKYVRNLGLAIWNFLGQ